jgi:ribonuclease HII
MEKSKNKNVDKKETKKQSNIKDQKYIIGIDEVGRGPVAGPVCVGAVLMTLKKYDDFKKVTDRLKKETSKIVGSDGKTKIGRLSKDDEFYKLGDLRDSKKLTENRRNAWSEKIHQWRNDGMLDFEYGTLTAKKIDQIGISEALKKCIEIALDKVGAYDLVKNGADVQILLDGSLHAPEYFEKQKTIIKGDSLEPIISLASVVAKVRRDQYMSDLAQKFPQYGFDNHKGYGTSSHMDAIKKHGISEFHRVSFLKNL